MLGAVAPIYERIRIIMSPPRHLVVRGEACVAHWNKNRPARDGHNADCIARGDSDQVGIIRVNRRHDVLVRDTVHIGRVIRPAVRDSDHLTTKLRVRVGERALRRWGLSRVVRRDMVGRIVQRSTRSLRVDIGYSRQKYRQNRKQQVFYCRGHALVQERTGDQTLKTTGSCGLIFVPMDAPPETRNSL